MRVSPTARRSLFYDWWESTCELYLHENFGDVGEQIRQNFTQTLFPPHAEPILPEQVLPISFIHMKLLAGEELGFVLQRIGKLTALFNARGAKPEIGIIYLMLTSLTSRRGKLSSMVKAQSAFFSLLLRRLASMYDDGVGENVIRKELSDVWEIQTEQAVNAALECARGLWRRSNDPNIGLHPLQMNLDSWLDDNGLTEKVAEARKMYGDVEEDSHLSELVRRLAAIEGLENSIEAGSEIERMTTWERMQAELMRSLDSAMAGVTPWESEILRPASPLLISLLAWAAKLQLLDEGETPTAYPGRERLPDWLKYFLSNMDDGGDVLSSDRFIVGGETYIVIGVDASASPELLSVVLDSPKWADLTRLVLNLRFGDGTRKSFSFDLENGRDLLAAMYLSRQDDVRLDIIVRGTDNNWRFGASSYLVMSQEHRADLVQGLLSFLEKQFGSDESRIRLEILKSIKRENDK